MSRGTRPGSPGGCSRAARPPRGSGTRTATRPALPKRRLHRRVPQTSAQPALPERRLHRCVSPNHRTAPVLGRHQETKRSNSSRDGAWTRWAAPKSIAAKRKRDTVLVATWLSRGTEAGRSRGGRSGCPGDLGAVLSSADDPPGDLQRSFLSLCFVSLLPSSGSVFLPAVPSAGVSSTVPLVYGISLQCGVRGWWGAGEPGKAQGGFSHCALAWAARLLQNALARRRDFLFESVKH